MHYWSHALAYLSAITFDTSSVTVKRSCVIVRCRHKIYCEERSNKTKNFYLNSYKTALRLGGTKKLCIEGHTNL